VKVALARFATVPFEAMIAALAAYSGGVGLLRFGANTDPLSLSLPLALVTMFQAGYLIAGLAMLVGLGTGRRNFEALGLVVVASSVLIRTVALVWVVGFTAPIINAMISSALVVLACVLRNRSLSRGDVIARIGESEQA
jgi:hypothetical protein